MTNIEILPQGNSDGDDLSDIKKKIEQVSRKFKWIFYTIGVLFIVALIYAALTFNKEDDHYEKQRDHNEQVFAAQKHVMDSIIQSYSNNIQTFNASIDAMNTQVIMLRQNAEEIRKTLKLNKVNYEKQIKQIQTASVDDLDTWFNSYDGDGTNQ